MGGHLKIWINSEEDGLGELFAEFSANGFSGRGHACFELASLAKKAEQFAQYPILVGQPIVIEGGYWSKDDATKICQEHLYISAYPTNSRGEIGLFVRLAEPHDVCTRTELRSSASTELKATYEQMAQFSRGLVSLVRGDIKEFVFAEIGE